MSKLKTGIDGLNEILRGGYPQGKATLLKGGPGTGKSYFCYLFAKQSLANGEQVIFLTSEESKAFTIEKMKAIGINSTKALREKKMHIIDLSPNFDEQINGQFEIEAIMLRVQASINSKKTVIILDSLQNIFLLLQNENNAHSLLKLFNWCRNNHITLSATIADVNCLHNTQYFEEYASDCVIKISQTISNKLMTRYLHVLKLRGSCHGSNQYPFLIHQNSISLLPITESLLEYHLPKRRASTGVEAIDKMLGGGYFRGSSLMVSGSSGTCKSLLLATMAKACAQKKKKVLYISFEESEPAFIQRVKSIDIDFAYFIKQKYLKFYGVRNCERGLEEHLITLNDLYDSFSPELLIIDPISALLDLGSSSELKSMIIRFVSHLQKKQVTLVMSELLQEDSTDNSKIGISSLSDTWIRLNYYQTDGELYRTIQITKSRGSYTSNQIKEFIVNDKGISVEEPYLGGGGLIFGSRKKERELLDKQYLEGLKDKLETLMRYIENVKTLQYSPYDTNYLHQVELLEGLSIQKNKTELEIQNIEAQLLSNSSLRKK